MTATPKTEANGFDDRRSEDRNAPGVVPFDRIVALFGGECFTVSDLRQVGMPLVYVSPEFQQLTGYSAAEARGRDLGFLQHSDTEQRGNRELRTAVDAGRPCTVILRNYRKDGSLFWNEQRHYPIRDDDGTVTHLVTVQRDVTERMNAAMSQDVGEAMARYLDEEGRFFGYSLLLRDDREPSLAWLSDAVRHVVGIEAATIQREGLASIVHPEDQEQYERRLDRIRRSVARHADGLPRRIFRDPYRLVAADGKVVWVEDAASVAWESQEAGVIAIHAVVRDITSLRKSQHAFWQLSHFDALTGLPNRNLLEDRLQQALLRAKRNQTHTAVAMIDLAPLRRSSERLAALSPAERQAGDRVLQRIAEDLRRTVRRSDTLARYDGDVFVLMLPDLPDVESVVPVLEKLRARLDALPQVGDADQDPAPAIGVTVSPDSGLAPADLLDGAREALEQAKAAGDTTYVLHDALVDDGLMARIRLRADVARAFERDEFVLHYQPRVDLATGDVRTVEALLRWVHPERGLLKPGSFLPSITSLEVQMDIFRWVLDAACGQAARWVEMRHPRRVAVNVHDGALDVPEFVDIVRNTLAEHDLHPALLELEIRDADVGGGLQAHAAVLGALRALGVRVGLDDFGVTPTPFEALRTLPLDTLKIAGKFQHRLTSGEPNAERALLASIVALGKSMDVRVVAEWVETKEQRQILQDLGCDDAQGFLFGHAIPAEHVMRGQLGPVDSGA